MRRFFIESTEANKPVVSLRGPDARHIKRVLRLQPGDTIRLFDSTGYEYAADIKRLSTGAVELSIAGRYPAATESPVRLVVAQAMLKSKKMDTLLRYACELGMNRWVPFISERSVSRPDQKHQENRVQRWQKIAKESFKQCRRSVLPQIDAPVSFKNTLELAHACDLKLIFWENETRTLTQAFASGCHESPGDIIVMLGPEGGFTPREIDTATDYGFDVVGLGPRVLRAETATLAACALMQYLFGDMG
jgi:16S rRNA (uracil1498-N3)-methyltransferase